MSHRAHGFNEGDDLTSEPQTLEVMVLATVPSTREATTPLSCFIIFRSTGASFVSAIPIRKEANDTRKVFAICS